MQKQLSHVQYDFIAIIGSDHQSQRYSSFDPLSHARIQLVRSVEYYGIICDGVRNEQSIGFNFEIGFHLEFLK